MMKRLKDIFEDINGETRDRNTTDIMKVNLRNLKVTDNCEGALFMVNKTYYTESEDDRSQYNK